MIAPVPSQELSQDEKYWLFEYKKCENPSWGWLYFINTHCRILHEDRESGLTDWLPFVLWVAQAKLLAAIHTNKHSIALKSRQVGITWILLFYALWNMMFRSNYRVGFWTYQDKYTKQAVKRLRGIIDHLPQPLRPEIITDNAYQIELANGSVFMAFNPNSGDSETFHLAIIDECELIDHLTDLINNKVLPTVGDIGKLVMISRVEKKKADTHFRRVWKNAINTARLFIGWYERPDRTQEWYNATKDYILSTDPDGIDAVWSQYPATPDEALAPATANRAVPHNWLNTVYQYKVPMTWDTHETLFTQKQVPAINGLEIFHFPEKGKEYVIGIDGAEGNPNSDDSSINIVDCSNPLRKIQVARLAGKFTPYVTANQADKLALFYNDAPILPERNNHGHAIIIELGSLRAKVIKGLDGNLGWLNHQRGKTIMYDDGIEDIRLNQCVIHSEVTYNQIASIEGATLRAPSGLPDDDSDSFMLALVAVGLRHKNQWYTLKQYETLDKEDIIRQRLGRRRPL